MTDFGVYDERRFAPAVREWRGSYDNGPTEQWRRYEDWRGHECEALVRVLWREGWHPRDIADYLGVARRWVRQLTVGLEPL